MTVIRWMCAFCFLTSLCAERWSLEYFYDKAESSFHIEDFAFSSARRGMAMGVIEERRKEQPSAAITRDGGATWEIVPLKELPLSLFFLDDGAGWMVSVAHPWQNSLWHTRDDGKSWQRVGDLPAQILRVYFADLRNGWAIGSRKTALATHDGGRHWTAIAGTSTELTRDQSYDCIAFAGARGLITGWERPAGNRLPEWLDPESAAPSRGTAGRGRMTFELRTSDGGTTWTPSSAASRGHAVRVRFGTDGTEFRLVGYAASPRSEVVRIDSRGRPQSLYASDRFDISDLEVAGDGTLYLVGVVAPGTAHGVTPGKLRILKSADYRKWTEMDVDYRAAGRRAITAVGGGRIWAATDTGMIVKLRDSREDR